VAGAGQGGRLRAGRRDGTPSCAAPPPGGEGAAVVRWWSPGPQRLQSEEEGEEEIQYLVSLLTGSLEIEDSDPEPAQPQTEAATAPAGYDHRALEEESVVEKREPQEDTHGSERENWETAKKDAWLREPPAGSRDDERKDGHTRVEESGRWIAKTTGSRDKGHCELIPGEIDKSVNVKVTTTSRGECIGLCEADVVMSS
jgi:hypothetical protein